MREDAPSPVPEAAAAISEDALLGGRVRLRQPVAGLRAAIDPVLLAAAVPAAPGDTVLDVGSGAGAAALCLAARVSGVRVCGVEIQRDLVRLAFVNAKANGFADRLDFVVGDLLRPAPRLAAGSFHHVMANPPFGTRGHGTAPPDPGKATAAIEGEAAFEDWLGYCLRMVRPKGTVTVIHRAERVDEVLAAMRGQLGGIVVFPLWPGPAAVRGAGEKPAKRVIVRGRKGAATPLRLAPGLVLHDAGGAYTPEAEAILRDGRGLGL